jgi:phosphopantothenate-cysteine ligase
LSFLGHLPFEDRSRLASQLDEFVVRHAGRHRRPIAVVSSGGTAVDLETNAVRTLENFSTGLRGAISVEEFLRRGYAVIHLWREGTAAPYARVLPQCLPASQPAHRPLSLRAVGSLLRAAGDSGAASAGAFDGDDAIVDENERDDLVAAVLERDREGDPLRHGGRRRHGRDDSEVVLSRSVARSPRLLRALRERSAALREGRVLTVPFRTVEDYLARLELAAAAVRDAGCLAAFYLAAAVSDFYLPPGERPEHKIQSRGAGEGGDRDGDDTRDHVLRLRPVPKALGLLRSEWAPQGFVVSFKLETDPGLLRDKASRAMDLYGSHLVVGNLLQTRHDVVWVLAPPAFEPSPPGTSGASSASSPSPASPSTPPSASASFVEIARPRPSSFPALDGIGVGSGSGSGSGDDFDEGGGDSLESKIVDFVVRCHFEYISYRYPLGSSNGDEGGDGYRAAVRARQALLGREEALRRRRLWRHAREWAWSAAGALLAFGLSYAINTTLQRRLLLARGR